MNGLISSFFALLAPVLFLFYPCDRLRCLYVEGTNLWKETEVYEHSSQAYRALLTAEAYMVRVEKNSRLTPNDAIFLTNLTTMQVSGVFDDARSPYPGVVSDKIRCDKKYKPDIQHEKNGNLDVTSYITSLNDRLQLGSCLDSELAYKSYNAIFYCPREGSLYHLEFITKRDGANDGVYGAIIRSISCRPHGPAIP